VARLSDVDQRTLAGLAQEELADRGENQIRSTSDVRSALVTFCWRSTRTSPPSITTDGTRSIL